MQFEKQEIERKLVKIMRNKHKPSEKPNIDTKNIDKYILNEINLLVPQNKITSNEPDWKLVRKTFEAKIK